MNNTYNRKIAVGLLAYGMSGKVFQAPFFSTHQGFNLKAVVERNEKKANLDYSDIVSYGSIEELLADDEIELVVVNTPNYLHFEHVKLALTKGKNVLVEKPFTATSRQAKELFALADKQGKQLFFFQNRRYDSEFLSAKKVLASGKIGKLNEMHIRYDRYRNFVGPKKFKESPMAASGLLYDLGPHLLDQAISLFGTPLNYHKVLGKNRAETLVDDFFSIQLVYPDSVYVFLTSSMLVVAPQPSFVLHGVTGTFVKDRSDVQESQLIAGLKPNEAEYGIEEKDKDGVLTTINDAGEKTTQLIPSERGDYMPLFESIYQAIVNNQAFPVTRAQVLLQLEILEN
ncbi:scyllo-inositol 2-dehydrogenase (NADP+) [Pedobacter sp. UYP30]|uniref:Gfo/Idh/MocA family oxidoreductase n=1 Tax=Pedobacter sp. UYP30 TaxID=1756400 RepID=UPI003394ECA1